MISRTILTAFMASVAAAQTTTIDFFIPGGYSGLNLAGIVAGACSGQTTYVLSCTSDSGDAYATEYDICTSGAGPFTYIEGASLYSVSSSIVTDGATAIVAESCAMTSSTAGGVCAATIQLTISGTTTSAVTTTTFAASEVQTYSVEITAGASLLTNSGSCKSTGKSSSGSSSSSGAGSNAVVFGTLLLGLASFGGMLLL